MDRDILGVLMYIMFCGISKSRVHGCLKPTFVELTLLPC